MKPAHDIEKPVLTFLSLLGEGIIAKGTALGIGPRLNLMLRHRSGWIIESPINSSPGYDGLCICIANPLHLMGPICFDRYGKNESITALMSSESSLAILAYLIALAWLLKTVAAARGLPRIPNLLLPRHDLHPTPAPTVTVIVPARDEAPNIEACLHSLLQQDAPSLQIIAVDDRSTDATGFLMDALALSHPTQLTAIHITELPSGWLGKTHALALAAKQAAVLTQPEFLLFTDADVVFRPDALRRALAHAVETRADHLVVMPTALVRRWDEGILLGAFQVLGMWALSPWRVADPRALRDAIGVGAFNLMRRSAYESLGGFEAQRMDILEDLTLARRVKQAGLRQRIAFGLGLAGVHWAAGARGILGVMTKNMFAVFRFHPALVAISSAWMVLFCVLPPFALLYAPARIPAAIVCLCILWAFHLYGRHSGIRAWNAFAFPIGAAAFVFALLRSMTVTLAQGGVRWRGTFYPLAELRKLSSPLFPPKSPGKSSDRSN